MKMIDEKKVLESQLRNCYAHTVYTHKAHEKRADSLLLRSSLIKWAQIGLSFLVTGGALVAILDVLVDKKWAELFTSIASALLFAFNLYTKENDVVAAAQQHRQYAAKIWLIREKYLSLLTDLRIENISLESIRSRRDKIIEEQSAIYVDAPSTNPKAYRDAQKALKENEEMTFSDEEIDKLLPTALRITTEQGNPPGID